MTSSRTLLLCFAVCFTAVSAQAAWMRNGVQSSPLEGELRPALQLYVEQQRPALGLPKSSTLKLENVISTRFGASAHFHQQVDGVEVDGARVVVTLDSNRQVVRLTSSAVRYARAKLEWNVQPQAALLKAQEDLAKGTRATDGTLHGGTKRTAFLVGEELHAGYIVYVPTPAPLEAWYVGVDAVTGEVLWRENRAMTANAAHVYPSSPEGGAPVEVQLPYLPTAPGFLDGQRITAWNCCPNEGCKADGAPKRSTGQFQTQGGPVNYDVAVCERRQVATNDPALHASGNFIYTPHDPPLSPVVRQSDPADSDAFAEVQAYYQVNRAYDFVRELSTGPGSLPGAQPFQMRDNRRGKKPAVWVNVTQPDFSKAQETATGLVSNALSRIDNAMFAPVESFEYASLPDYALDVDGLIIYQGDRADFAYDSPVLWHEFTHGVIYSSAAFMQGYHLDGLSTLNHGGALHESLSDYFAAALGNDPRIGAYVSKATSGANALRTLANDYKCPDVLWGESHQDGQHLSGALWEARTTVFKGTDNGRTFDAIVFAALVSLNPRVTLEDTGEAVADQVGLVLGAPAKEQMLTLLKDRGVIGCSMVLDGTENPGARPVYILPGWRQVGVDRSSVVPGPYQIRLKAPRGATKLVVKGINYSYGGASGQTEALRVAAKKGAAVQFSIAGTTLKHDAMWDVAVTRKNQQEFSAELAVDVPCGDDLYFTFTNQSGFERVLQNVSFAFEPLESCPVVVEEPVDAGTDPVPTPATDGAPTEAPSETPEDEGCGCGAGAQHAPWALAGWGLLVRARRVRRN